MFKELLDTLPWPAKPGTRTALGPLPGSAPARLLAEMASAAQFQLVITADTQTANTLQRELRFYGRSLALDVLTFPDWETLPYDSFSPHQDIISGRLATLYRLSGLRDGLLIVSVATLLQRLPPADFIYKNSLILNIGERLVLEEIRSRLDSSGYRCVAQVMEHGEFAVRGSLLDLYPMGSELPYRIDLFDEEIESIRTFDPETQRSLERQDSIRLLPAREFPLDEPGIRHFRRQFRITFEGDPQASSIYRDVSQGIAPPGIEYFLPLFFEQTSTLFDYLPDNTCIVELDGIEKACEQFCVQLQERYEARRHDIERPILPPPDLYLDTGDLQHRFAGYTRVSISLFKPPAPAVTSIDYAARIPGEVRIRPRLERPAGALEQFLNDFAGRVLISVESTGRRETLLDQLHGFGLRPEVLPDWHAFSDGDAELAITVAPLEQGLLIPRPELAIITETALFGEHARQTRRRKPARDPAGIIRNLTDLELHAPVVHEEHGVGRYLGLEILRVGEYEAEYLALEYAGGDKLYVPVASLALVSRYTSASPENAPLHKLGSEQWARARQKAGKRIRDAAAELLDVYARRAARKGHAFGSPQDDYAAFAAAFPFEETPDQQTAIDAVITDMTSPRPMDRLVCGDVGFGKTEVAMRAAFLAVQGGKQVAVLVPTTLLAQQHFDNLSDRFADWPVRIESLSRFRTAKEQ